MTSSPVWFAHGVGAGRADLPISKELFIASALVGVPASFVFGDVFRAFNPWRAIGRAVAWVAQTAARGPLPAPLTYPERLGRWPAAVGIFAFVTLEIVVSGGDLPRTVAIATLVYSAVTFVMVGFTILALLLLLQSNV